MSKIKDQNITDKYSIFNADCIEVMQGLPDSCIGLSVYSPPFGGLYHYSSDDRDLSNNTSYPEFFEHYKYVIKELARITMPGRITCVHAMDVPRSNSGTDALIDFPGDLVRAYESEGWAYTGRRAIWKEPLAVRLRTMQKNLAHASLVADSIDCGVASADYLLTFRNKGKNPVPVQHPVGLLNYAGERDIPHELMKYRGYTGKQTENRYSHWIWRQYADCMWDDIRLGRVLPYKEGRENDDEKHVHPLQMDVIERCVVMWSNPGETVFTPFMGVGSEVYGALMNGRKGIGIELKSSYYRQALKNCEAGAAGYKFESENEEFDFGETEVA